jgi:hypothetical protein
MERVGEVRVRGRVLWHKGKRVARRGWFPEPVRLPGSGNIIPFQLVGGVGRAGRRGGLVRRWESELGDGRRGRLETRRRGKGTSVGSIVVSSSEDDGGRLLAPVLERDHGGQHQAAEPRENDARK